MHTRRAAGPAAALALVEELELDHYYPLHLRCRLQAGKFTDWLV
jgi:hypothetical protein